MKSKASNIDSVAANLEGIDEWDEDIAHYESLRTGKLSTDKTKQSTKRKPASKAKARGSIEPLSSDIETLNRQITLDDEEDGPPIPLADKPDALPVSLLRSALFTVRIGSVENIQRCEIASQSGTRVVYEGPLLNQHDKLVWATALRLARQSGKPINSLFMFTKRHFLSEMGWAASGNNVAWVWKSLVKLSRASVLITRHSKDGKASGMPSVCGTMLGNVLDSTRTRHFAFRFNPELLPQLAASDIHADIHFLRRSMLRLQLSQWLHDFYSTHSGDSSLPVSSIRSLCGIGENYTNADFRKKLRESLKEILKLPDITNEKGEAVPRLFLAADVVRSEATGDWRLAVKLGEKASRVHFPAALAAGVKPIRKPRTGGKGRVAL
jgi:hypothetical protein